MEKAQVRSSLRLPSAAVGEKLAPAFPSPRTPPALQNGTVKQIKNSMIIGMFVFVFVFASKRRL